MNTNTLSGHSNKSGRWVHSLVLVLVTILVTIWASLSSFADAAPYYSISIDPAPAVVEGGTATFRVTVNPAVEAGDTVTVRYSTLDTGSAKYSDGDFTQVTNQILTFNPGDSFQNATVNTTDDTVVENQETFPVELSDPTSITLSAAISVATADGTINDNDQYSISIADASAVEGTAVSFTITLSAARSMPVDVTATLADGTATLADSDYTNASGLLTIPAGPAAQTYNFSVPTTADAKVESNETFTVTLTSADLNATMPAGPATGTITNDDAYSVSIADGSAAEGTAVSFTITLSAARSMPVDVTATLADGTATLADSDYTNASGLLTIPAGPAAQTYNFSVPTTADAKVESNETFTVTLTSADLNATMPAGPAAGTITNDDAYSVSIADGSAAEGTAVSFTITLSAARSMPVDVTATVADATATLADSDYTNASGLITIPAGPAAQTYNFSVPTTADAKVESNETFTVTLTSADLNATMPAGPAAGTITNDDAYSVSIADGSAAEGTAVSFTITLSAARSMPVDVTATVADATATLADSDYTNASGLLTIPAGPAAQTYTFSVPTTADAKVESNETFTVTLTSADLNATMPAGPAAGTITNDDAYSVSIADGSAAEGTAVSFTITLSAARSMPVDVTATVADATATLADSDYTNASGLITIPAGPAAQTYTFSVPTTADAKVESNETFTVTLTSADLNATMPAGPATGTITNDDAYSVSIGDGSAAEGSAVSFTITLSAARSMPVDVTATVADATATLADTDYSNVSGLITIPAGPAAQTYNFSVPTTADAKVESNETFTVTLTSADLNATMPAGPATGTITNDDAYSVSIADGSAAEGTAVSFTITLSAARSMPVDVTATVADATATLADSDYTNASGLLTIPAGPAAQTYNFSVPTTADAKVESNETFTVTLTSADLNATMPAGPATGTITNDDAYSVTIADGSAAEGSAVSFTITLSAARSMPVDVTATVADATATLADSDYTNASGLLTIPAGPAAQTYNFSVPTTADAKVESNETFTVTLTSADLNATMPAGPAAGTITNDDGCIVTIGDGSAAEGSAVSFTITLSAARSMPVDVTATVADATATLADSDYTNASGLLTIPAGPAAQTYNFSVPTTADAKVESNETFTVTLTSADLNATMPAGPATGTITNDDQYNLSIANASATEGAAVNFTITLSAARSMPVDVTATVADATATLADSDYTNVSGLITIPAGPAAQTYTFSVPTIPDFKAEPNETFTVTLTSADLNAAIPAGPATGTITNDDYRLTVSKIGAAADGACNITASVGSVSGAGGGSGLNFFADYENGDVVTLTVTDTYSSAGSIFKGWGGSIGGSAYTTTVIMDSDKTVTANFNATYTFSISTAGTGAGRAVVTSGSGGDSSLFPGGDAFGAYLYELGDVVSLTGTDYVPTADTTGSEFENWTVDYGASGGGFSTGSKNTSVTISGDLSIIGNFRGKYMLTSIARTGGGITPLGSVIKYHGESQAYTVSASASFVNSDVVVDGFSQGAQASYTFDSLSNNHTIIAVFQAGSEIYEGPVAGDEQIYSVGVPPMVLMVMGKDHKLFYEAYNDASDLNGDGALDVGYNPEIDYYGYFDSYKVYRFDSTNLRFYPVRTTADKKKDPSSMEGSADPPQLNGEWSGDFLNYLTMSRIDALRKVLYGGYRHVDTATETVLMRSYIPQDAHAWGKEYQSIARDGYDIRDYAPYNLPSAGARHLFANVTLEDGATNLPALDKPLLRVLDDSYYRIWEWVSIERPVAGDQCDSGTRDDCGRAAVIAQHPGHPGNAGQFQTLINTYAVPTKLIGTGAVARINGSGNPWNPDPDNNYLSIFTGSINVTTAGSYRFAVDGDDAVEVLIDGVVRYGRYSTNGPCNCTTYRSAAFNLSSGQHTVEFRQEVASGPGYYYLYWRGPDSGNVYQIIPAAKYTGLTMTTYNLVTDSFPGSQIVNYEVKVLVGTASLSESNCKRYPNGTYKPTGILQKFGEPGKLNFGLMTGSYAKNTSGGVLRKAVGSFTDEIVANTGQFKHKTDPNFKGIVYTIDQFRILNFTYSDYTHQNCGWITTRPINEGECVNWGNPIGEMIFEGLRYFAGHGSATTAFTYGTTSTLGDNVLGLPKATWDDPFVTNGACAKPFILAITDINPSYDSNQLPGVASAFGTGFTGTLNSNDSTPVAFDAEDLGEAISTAEGVTGNRYMGQVSTTYDNSCSPKDMTGNGFGRSRGLCPEEPTKQGSFYSASSAYFGRTHDINAAEGTQNVLSYIVGLASPLPRLEIPVGTGMVTLVPFAKSVGGCLSVTPTLGAFQPTNTIVDFYIESLRPASGTFRINYEDVEQGADHDMDAVVIYFYQVIDDAGNPVENPAFGTGVKISVESEYAAGCIVQHIGYIISGTTADGTYLVVRDSDTNNSIACFTGGDCDYYLDTPPGVTPPATTAQWGDNVPLPLVSERIFTPGTTTAATLLETPLWYAAKWGGFVDQNDNNIPDLQSEWDSDGDGAPDTYFYVVNPLKLEQQLTRTFSDILSRGVSHVAPVVSVDEANRTQSGDRLYMAFFKPISDNYWQGNLKKYGLDYRVRDDCGRTIPEWTVVDGSNEDSSLAATAGYCDGTFKPGTQSFWSSEPDGGVVDKGGVGGRLKARMPGTDPRVPVAPYYDFRNIYTYKGALDGSMVRFIHANITNTDLEVAGDLARYRIINFIYGYTYDAVSSANSNPLSKREWLLGDIIHSEPRIIDYFDDTGALTHRFIAVGANDGMLHVFTDSSVTIGGNAYLAGDEVFAFIPQDLLRRLQEFGSAEGHRYMVDGSPGLYRASTKTDGTNYDMTLVFGERSGGRSYWALDVSKPNPADWKVKWHIQGGPGGTAGFEELGYTWSKPFVTRLKTGTSTTKEVVIVAGGYDTIEDGFPEGFDDQNKNGRRDTGELHGVTLSGTEGYDKWNPGMDNMGRGIFVLDLSNGNVLFKASYGASDVTTGIDQKFAMMKYCIPADISVIPLSDSNLIMYAADVYGQIWRVRYDFAFGLGTWNVQRVFAANPGSTLASGDATTFTNGAQTLNTADAGRKMFYSPDVSLFGNDWTSKPVLYVGTGDRQHPRYTMISNRMYFVTDAGSVADETDLLNLTCGELEDDATVDPDTKIALRNILEAGTNSVRGFYRVLDQQGNCPDDDLDHTGEHILSQPTLFYKNVYFTSYQPVFDDPCNPVGNAFIYALDFSLGTSAFNYDVMNDTAESNIRTLKDTYRFISGSSIPSGVRIIMRDGHAAGLISAGGAVAGIGEDGSTTIPGPPGGITPLMWETE